MWQTILSYLQPTSEFRPTTYLSSKVNPKAKSSDFCRSGVRLVVQQTASIAPKFANYRLKTHAATACLWPERLRPIFV